VTTPKFELIIFPFQVPVPGTSKVPAVKLVTFPVHVPAIVNVPEKFSVALPVPTIVKLAPELMVKLAPAMLLVAEMDLFVLITQVVANVPESQRPSIPAKINSKVPSVPGTAYPPGAAPPATEYCIAPL
jgi:hypothetical protein